MPSRDRFAPSTAPLAAAWLAVIAVLGAAAAGSQTEPPSGTADSQVAPLSFTLQGLHLSHDAGDAVLTLVSSDPLGLVGVQPDPDGSLVVQLPGHAPGPAIRDVFPEGGPILAIRVSVEQTSRGPLTRAVITPRTPLSYSFAPEGRELRVRLRPRGAPAPSVEAATLRRRNEEMETALAASRQERDRLASRNASLSADRDLLSGRFEAMEVRRRDLEAALEATLAEIEALAVSAGRPATSEELAAVRRERDDLAQRVAEITGALERAEVAREESEAQLQVWRAEIDRVAQGAQVSGDERALAEIRQRLEQAVSERDQLRGQLTSARTVGVSRGRTRGGVHLRQAPSTESESLTLLPEGVSLEVLGRQGDWVQVRAGSRQGWVYGLLIELESETVARLQTALAETESARRDLAGRLSTLTSTDASARVDELAKANAALREEVDRLTTREVSPRQSAEGNEAGEGRAQRGRTLTGVHLREAPSVDSSSLMLIPAETMVQLLGLENGWYRVRQGTTEGWAFADLLTPVSEEIARLESELAAARSEIVRLRSTAPSAAPPPVEGVEVAWVLESVNLRDQPGMEQAVLGVLEAGTRVSVLQAGGAWHQVRSGQLTGWVYRDYLSGEPAPAASSRAARATPPLGVSPTADSPLPPATPLARSERRQGADDPRPARTVARVFLRAGPGAEQESIALISEDTLIQILEERGDWRRVVVRGTEGWMYGPLLEPLD